MDHGIEKQPEDLVEARASQPGASPVSKNTNETFARGMTFGERLADRVASFGGSWAFIIGFGVFLAGWVSANLALGATAGDPYPFIFLNLVLSMIAALQAPIIMMSQNRQAAKDRLAAEHDYEVNLKAELEIIALHDKIDAFRVREMDGLLRQQQQQIDLLTRLVEVQSRPSQPLLSNSRTSLSDVHSSPLQGDDGSG